MTLNKTKPKVKPAGILLGTPKFEQPNGIDFKSAYQVLIRFQIRKRINSCERSIASCKR